MSMQQATPTLPTVERVLLEVSLYTSVYKAIGWGKFIHTLRWGVFQFDAHCVRCGTSSTFKSAWHNLNSQPEAKAIEPGYFSRTIKCARDDNHFYVYEFRLTADDLQKIGQFPAIEDIIGSDLKRYNSVLDQEDFRELRRATGLFSHGIGIGSFVYLRRIFERMIYKHRDEAEASSGAGIPDFGRMRMDEKIGALAAVLPPALVKNKAVYSILSKGIHELGEDECRKYFPVVRAAIIQILEQDLETRQRQKAEQELEKEIARIHGEVAQS